MTRDERHNEVLKLKANFSNALAIGAIVAGGFAALNNSNWLALLVFSLLGVAIHGEAVRTLGHMRVTDAG